METRLKCVFRKFSVFGDELGHIVILSVGIVRVTPELGDDVPRLVEAAETAKNSIGDVTYKSHYAYYSPEIEQERLLICHIENRMEAALEKPIDLVTVSTLEQKAQMPSEAQFRETVIREMVNIYDAA